jgi:hypothetical protein
MTEQYTLIDNAPNINFIYSTAPDLNALIPLREFFNRIGRVPEIYLDKTEALLVINFRAGWLSISWNAILNLRPQTILVDGLYFDWIHTIFTNNFTLHLIHWVFTEDGLHPQMLMLTVENRMGKWVTLENEDLAGGETVHMNQELSIDPDFKQIKRKDLDMIRAIREAGGKMKVLAESGAQGVTWTTIAKMEKMTEEEKRKENLVHGVFVYWEGKSSKAQKEFLLNIF